MINQSISNKTDTNYSYCSNCGRHGHLYKDCNEPITSYGIITFCRTENNQILFLNINRKHSIGFVEFIRGKYMYNNNNTYTLNTEYAFIIFKNMSNKERHLIEIESFEQLWSRWCPVHNTNPKSNEYIYARNKYNRFKQGIYIKNNVYSLKSVMDKTFSVYDTPEWGFPKGRKHKKNKETDLDCALREFEEETDFSSTKLKIIHKVPIYEKYTGFNNIMYRNVYYVAEFCSNDKQDYEQICLNQNNNSQSLEISQVRWLSYDESVQKIRPYHNERIKILKQIYTYITNTYYYPDISLPFSMPSIISVSDVKKCIAPPAVNIMRLLPNLNMF